MERHGAGGASGQLRLSDGRDRLQTIQTSEREEIRRGGNQSLLLGVLLLLGAVLLLLLPLPRLTVPDLPGLDLSDKGVPAHLVLVLFLLSWTAQCFWEFVRSRRICARLALQRAGLAMLREYGSTPEELRQVTDTLEGKADRPDRDQPRSGWFGLRPRAKGGRGRDRDARREDDSESK